MRSMYLRCRTSGSATLRALALALAASLAGLPLGGTVVHAQQPIQLFLSAVDNDGKPVTDLKEEEVTIQVDGATCTTTRFESINWPTRLTVMVDNSPVFNDSLRQLREALRAFVTALPTDIEVSLLSTAPAPRFIYKQGNDRVKLMSSIDLITPDGSAPRFIDALAEAAERTAKEKAGKEKSNFFPVFFIVGNNGVEGSSPRDYQVTKLFKQTIDNAVTVHIVMLSNSSRPARHRLGHESDRGRAQADADHRRPLRSDCGADEAHLAAAGVSRHKSPRATRANRTSTGLRASRPPAPRANASRRRPIARTFRRR